MVAILVFKTQLVTRNVQEITAGDRWVKHVWIFVGGIFAKPIPNGSKCGEAGCYAKPYAFTARSKTALINGLALMLEQKMITLPRPEIWPEGIDELEAFEYSVSDAGNVRTGAPSGVHDDCVIGLALAAWELRPRACGYTETPLWE